MSVTGLDEGEVRASGVREVAAGNLDSVHNDRHKHRCAPLLQGGSSEDLFQC